MEQRTDDWFAARCGKVTASRIADLMARTKTGYSSSRANYKAQLVCERLTGCVEPSYCNAAMQWGIDKEAEARRAYEFLIDRDVIEEAFVLHPTIEMAGASPDGLVGDDGLVEIKCPISATHIDTLLNGAFADKYVKQALFQMACTGRQWCDLVSYDPRLPERMRLFVRRIERDAEAIAEIEAEVCAFLAEIDETVGKLLAAYEPEKEAA
jgi:putative phage-type endonuclease